ncbi:hypothetical protein [Xanthomonas fragariae]|uniref:hypothetical protein n=1 Tax=Xanthomonas fragariae TaxID=48664 RepID=UPI00131F1F43|nr:hypothetical protein [Xanthomonas fragariae]MEA5248917.1 hypothetical protein [Xanthomonas fragariae]
MPAIKARHVQTRHSSSRAITPPGTPPSCSLKNAKQPHALCIRIACMGCSRITSHHITSHHITSHHITSHHITSHRNADADADAVKTVPDQHWLSSASGKTAPDGVDAMTI